jgi:hypothetical protein
MRNMILAVGIILAGISANLGVVGTSPGSLTEHSEAASPAVVRPSRATNLKNAEDHPLNILYDYYKPKIENDAPGPASPEMSGKFELNLSKAVLNLNVRVPAATPQDLCSVDEIPGNPKFMIATVVDPTRTHLALAFDRQLEAIMRAAQDSEYVFHDYWLPWRTETPAESPDASIQEKREAEGKRRAKLPGLLFFRGKESYQGLAVFLVGETPTEGIDRDQFNTAACFAKHLRPRLTLAGILGPTFSGSFQSLQRALHDEKSICGRSCLGEPLVLSGTTTSPDAIRDFQQDKDGFPGFTTTLHNDELAHVELRNKYKWSRVAILAEGDTVYGSTFNKVDFPPDTIYYPREISRLRNAYQDDPTLARQANPDPQAARKQLLLPLRDQNGRDTVPQFSAGQTPVTQETILFQIAAELKERRYDAAVVTGSNVLDTLFLSRFLRENCPDVRIATLDSDLLFVHGTDSLDYLGTLSVSSYPLLPDLLPLPNSYGQHFFASNAEEGVYNAASFLLGGIPRDYANPFQGDSSRPALWLSVVGRGGYWPLGLLEPDKSVKPTSISTMLSMKAPPSSRVWNGVFWAASLLCLLYAGVYLIAIRHKQPLERWCADFHSGPDESNLSDRMPVYFVLTTLLLLAAYWVLSFPVFLLAVRPGHDVKGWLVQTLACVAIAGTLVAVSTHSSLKFWRRGQWVVAIFILGLVAWMGLWTFETSESARFFYAVRSVQIPSGVDPSVPLILLFLALAWWTWTNWQRRIFVMERDPLIPDLAKLKPDLTDDLQNLLKKKLFPQDWYALIIAVFALAGTMAGWRWLPSLESRPYDWLFLTLLSITGAALLTTAWGYYQIWRRLRILLEAINLHPLRLALDRLPAVSSWSPLWQSSVRARNYILPERFVEVLERLRSEAPGYYSALSNDLTELKEEIATVSHAVQMQEREDPAKAQEISKSENRIAAELGKELLLRSWSRGASESLCKIENAAAKDKSEKSSPDPLPDLLAAEAIALRYLAFIRYAMLHLQNQLNFLTVGFILTAVALNSYPFQGRSYVRWWTTVVFVLAATAVADVFIKMGRDATLSHLTDTASGKVDSGTYLRMLSAGALPLLAVSASHFPSVGRFLFSWLQPALSALH